MEEHDRLLPPELPSERVHERGVGVDVHRAVAAGLELVEQVEGLRSGEEEMDACISPARTSKRKEK